MILLPSSGTDREQKSHKDSFPLGKKNLHGFFRCQFVPRIFAEYSFFLEAQALLHIKRLLPIRLIKNFNRTDRPPIVNLFYNRLPINLFKNEIPVVDNLALSLATQTAPKQMAIKAMPP